ncbi:MAG: helix-turn-helix transcriptional regulator [Deltaproteobacteria bacterium]|nr:MAG: helix-turn-helix transcriptional regulator [Deltaproteobacteria bacterium]
MQRTSFRDMHCSLARTLDVAGEWWSPLILRDLFVGVARFDELQEDLGISAKVLSERLRALTRAGIAERKPYQSRPRRDSYVLTAKGRALVPPLLALMAWGDRWASPDGRPPMLLRHERCGRLMTAQVTCSRCGGEIVPNEVTPLAGPGGARAAGTRVIAKMLAPAQPVREAGSRGPARHRATRR